MLVWFTCNQMDWHHLDQQTISLRSNLTCHLFLQEYNTNFWLTYCLRFFFFLLQSRVEQLQRSLWLPNSKTWLFTGKVPCPRYHPPNFQPIREQLLSVNHYYFFPIFKGYFQSSSKFIATLKGRSRYTSNLLHGFTLSRISSS